MRVHILSLSFLVAWAMLVTAASFAPRGMAARRVGAFQPEASAGRFWLTKPAASVDSEVTDGLAWYNISGSIREGLYGIGSKSPDLLVKASTTLGKWVFGGTAILALALVLAVYKPTLNLQSIWGGLPGWFRTITSRGGLLVATVAIAMGIGTAVWYMIKPMWTFIRGAFRGSDKRETD